MAEEENISEPEEKEDLTSDEEETEELLDEDEEGHSSRQAAIKNVNITLSAVLGKTTLRVHQLLKLGRGAVVELNHYRNDPIEIIANDVIVAEGEIIVTENNKIGIRITEVMKSNF